MTIAVVGDPAHPYEIHDYSERWPPYGELPKVALEASEEEQIVDVLTRAAGLIGVDREGSEYPFVPAWINFYRPQHDEAYTGDHTTAITLVDERGRAHWQVWFHEPEVTVGALVRAAGEGELNGDPLRPYLVLEPGYGNGWLPDWQEVLIAWVVFREVIGLLADGKGAADATASLRDRARNLFRRFRRTPDVVERHYEKWQQRGGWPHSIDEYLRSKAWRSDVLAKRLDVELEEAEGLLEGFGFVYDAEQELWTPDPSQDSEVLRRVTRRLFYEPEPSDDFSPEGLRVRMEEEIVEYLANGIPPDEPLPPV